MVSLYLKLKKAVQLKSSHRGYRGSLQILLQDPGELTGCEVVEDAGDVVLAVHEVGAHDQRGDALHLLLLVLRGVRQRRHLQLLPGVLLLGRPGDLHTLAHRVVIEMDASPLRTNRGTLEYEII